MNRALTLNRAKQENEFSYVSFDQTMGHTEIESRLRHDGPRWIGEGRSRHYDYEGKLTKDTGWQPTGVELVWPEKLWWEFWK